MAAWWYSNKRISLNLSLNLVPTWLLFYCLLIPIRKPKHHIIATQTYKEVVFTLSFLSPTFSNNKKLNNTPSSSSKEDVCALLVFFLIPPYQANAKKTKFT
jgi:hypothetical protein